MIKFDEILGLSLSGIKKEEIPLQVQRLAKERQRFRDEKRWEESDKLREKIEEKGYIAEDTDEGPKLIKK